MAQRPIFVPTPGKFPYVKENLIEFEWHPGFAKAQTQKSIDSLHKATAKSNIEPVLEISSKSSDPIGVALSAFNLTFSYGEHKLTVESAYQGSKIFSNGGPFTDLYSVSSRDAKKDERIRNSGSFIGYNFFSEDFPSYPTTAFYDWLYLTALSQNLHLAEKLLNFKGFSDIVFNPKKSLNCQARAAALYVSLRLNNKFDFAIEDKKNFFDIIFYNRNEQNLCQDAKTEFIQLELLK